MNSLNPKVFDKDVEQAAIRKGFGEGFLLAGKESDNVVGLCADLTESTQMILFKNAFPERFIEVGVAEQNLASVASGMAAMGKVPFHFFLMPCIARGVTGNRFGRRFVITIPM